VGGATAPTPGVSLKLVVFGGLVVKVVEPFLAAPVVSVPVLPLPPDSWNVFVLARG